MRIFRSVGFTVDRSQTISRSIFHSSDSRGGSHLKQDAGSIFSSDSLRPLSSYVSRSLSLLHLLIPQRLGGAAGGAGGGGGLPGANTVCAP